MTARILCPVDLGHEASWRIALPEAAAEARLRQAELHLIAVVPDIGMAILAPELPPGFEEGLVRRALAELRALAAAQLPAGLEAQCHVAHGHAAEEILAAAARLEATLIVMASHRPDTLRTLLVSSVAEKIVHHAPQSVLVVRRG